MTTHQQSEYADEAERRWGNTDQYRESQRRTASYTEQDWAQIKAAGADLNRRLAEALRSGADPTDATAMDLAEEHRQQITRWYYDCSYDMHRNLGEMYVADPRFTATYEVVAPGLADYLNRAIQANADRHA